MGRPAVVVGNDIFCGLTGSTCFIYYTEYKAPTSSDKIIIEAYKENSLEYYETSSDFVIEKRDPQDTKTGTVTRFEYLKPIKN